MEKRIEIETQTFNFYGTDRYGRAGFHPSERMSEREEFDVEVETTYDDDGEILDSREIGAMEQYAAVNARAKDLLAIWPDQPAILVRDQGDEEFTVYREIDTGV